MDCSWSALFADTSDCEPIGAMTLGAAVSDGWLFLSLSVVLFGPTLVADTSVGEARKAVALGSDFCDDSSIGCSFFLPLAVDFFWPALVEGASGCEAIGALALGSESCDDWLIGCSLFLPLAVDFLVRLTGDLAIGSRDDVISRSWVLLDVVRDVDELTIGETSGIICSGGSSDFTGTIEVSETETTVGGAVLVIIESEVEVRSVKVADLFSFVDLRRDFLGRVSVRLLDGFDGSVISFVGSKHCLEIGG